MFIDSEGNFTGNVSFEGNHASIIGGKGKFEDAPSANRKPTVAQVQITFRETLSRRR